jgi:hypothetical protein
MTWTPRSCNARAMICAPVLIVAGDGLFVNDEDLSQWLLRVDTTVDSFHLQWEHMAAWDCARR